MDLLLYARLIYSKRILSSRLYSTPATESRSTLIIKNLVGVANEGAFSEGPFFPGRKNVHHSSWQSRFFCLSENWPSKEYRGLRAIVKKWTHEHDSTQQSDATRLRL